MKMEAKFVSENLEFQRYGRNKSTLVNHTYISSGKYRNKFDKIIDNKHVSRILYSESINNAIEGRNNVIAVHTHPCSMPPSIADFNSIKEHNYMLGVVLCHDGKIFCYKSNEKIGKMMYNLYVADYYLQYHDEYLAQLEALKELAEIYDIEFWEV